jgi:hypothetical protein
MRRNAFPSAILMVLTLSPAGLGRSAHADDRPGHVREISERGALILADDREVCLGGLWLGGPAPNASSMAAVTAALRELIDDRPVRIEETGAPSFDRYGCRLAAVDTAGRLSLQRALLERGLAMVRPEASAAVERIDDWLALEERARAAGIGLWADPTSRPRKPSALDDDPGTMVLIEGRVVRHSDNDRYAYLNFGQDWRTDFTVRLDQRLLKQGGIDAAFFDGKTLRVRGVVQQSRGPLIDITHLKHIEVMP